MCLLRGSQIQILADMIDMILFQGVHLSDVLCSLHGAVVDDEDSRAWDIG